MKLYIKNMVCNRCRFVVRTELEKLGYKPSSVELGEVEFNNELSKQDITRIENKLHEFDFELIDDSKKKTIEKIKKLLIELSQPDNDSRSEKLSTYLSKHFSKEYNYLSNLFSEVEGQTIEHYFISLKVEKVKELIKYGQSSISEIAWQMGYSSVAHLSKQFKQFTGMTPTQLKSMSTNTRMSIDNL